MAVLQTVRYPIHAIQTTASSHVSRLFVISPTIAMLLSTIGRLFENFLILDSTTRINHQRIEAFHQH